MTTGPRPTRVLVVGAGLIGKDHVAAIAADPTLELAGIADRRAERRALTERLGVPWYPTLCDALADQGTAGESATDNPGGIDGVIVATPNASHVELATIVIEAGLPLLLEKPVADTLDAARALHRRVRELDATVLVGHHRVHSPIMRAARQVVAEGVLGDLVAVNGTALFHKPDHYFEPAWRRSAGAGPILLNLVHEIQNLRLLCGEVVAVQAMTSNARRGFEVEDSAALLLRFDTGVLGTFLLSDVAASPRSWEQTSQENPAFPAYPDQDCYHLAGTRGSLSVPTMRVHRYLDAGDASWWEPFATSAAEWRRADPIAAENHHFGEVIRGEAAPACTLRDGLANQAVLDAIGRAARSGRETAVDLPG